jgi:electron transfer flavoprotein beta subunit
MTPGGIFAAFQAEIPTWNRAKLVDTEDSNLGLKGSPTQIAKASDKVRKGAGTKVNLDASESIDYIVDKRKEKHIV